ncbi:MAG: ABC transporter ATP-binding protein [Spirochaetes bacterium]|nr:ABC transporter ATP-binding protein [Spirochaetota bacterium]
MKNVYGLFRFLKPYRRECVVSLVLLVLVIAMDLLIPRLVQRIIDQGIAAGSMDVVVRTFLIMLAVSLLDTAFAIGNNRYSIRVGEGVARDLRDAMFLKIQSFSFGNLDRLKTGEIMVRLSSDTGVVQRLFQVSLRIGTRAPIIMAGSIALMFATNRGLALAILPLLLVTAVIIVVFSVRMKPLFLTMQERLDRLGSVLQENLAGVRVVRAFSRSARESERFGEANESFTARNVQVMRVMSVMNPMLTFSLNAGMVIVIWVGGLASSRNGISTGQIVAFVNYLQTTVVPLMNLVNLANIWAAAIVSAKRVNEVLDTVPDVRESPGAEPLPASEALRIEFRDAGFRYPGSLGNYILRGVNLVIEPGSFTAILGATGSGKSTLVNLIPRFYDLSEGCLLVNGFDVRTIRQQSLLSGIAVVPQETTLFSGTIRDNIRYGRPDASDAEVVAAAAAAEADAFIRALPGGYDSRVEERGVNFSGGQKQRIAIARALLVRPQVLILDDSTSSVDVETETRIQDAIARIVGNGTRIVVAQRVSTILKADTIVVLSDGRVAAQGHHRELLAASPIYREICESQLGLRPEGAPVERQ